nr:MAG TPA: hypothetical protein [Caudoviricetes sp.]
MCYYSNVMFQQKVLFKSELIVYIFLRKRRMVLFYFGGE